MPMESPSSTFMGMEASAQELPLPSPTSLSHDMSTSSLNESLASDSATNSPASLKAERRKQKKKFSPGGADGLLPILIYLTIHARVPHLRLSSRFIMIARNPNKLKGESEYYFTLFQLVISWLERVDASDLTIDKDEYDRCMRAAETNLVEEEKRREADLAAAAEAKLVAQSSVDAKALEDRKSAETSMGTKASPQQGGIEGKFRFLHSELSDLTWQDVGPLLEEYKSLAHTLIRLQRTSKSRVDLNKPLS